MIELKERQGVVALGGTHICPPTIATDTPSSFGASGATVFLDQFLVSNGVGKKTLS